jgi:hypothetical protein
LRGAGNAAPREQLASLIASRGADAAALAAARETSVAQTATSGQNLSAQLAASQAMRGGEMSSTARSQLAGRLAEIDAEIADVEGPGRTKLIQQIRGDERQWLGEQAAFGIDRQKAAADAAYKRASVRQRDRASQRTARQRALDRRQRARDKALDRQMKRDLDTTSGGRTPSQRRTDRQNLNKAKADIRTTVGAHPAIKLRTERGRKLRSQAATALERKYGYSHKQALALVQRATVKRKTPRGRSKNRMGARTS